MERRDGYSVERLVLDLNGFEPVPALVLVPDRRAERAPGLLYMHWHAGMYDLGKEQLLEGAGEIDAWAPELARLGIVTLAIDSWCFGERRRLRDGGAGELEEFKRMLWRGQVLFGMMLFDEFRALEVLAARPEVDPGRLGVMGMSMGATKAWWLAALTPAVGLCVDVCCLTDFDELMAAGNLNGHGVYYYVPGLLKEFDAAGINALIVPRRRLSLNGARDALTPAAGVGRVRDHLAGLYGRHGRAGDCRIELFDCAHEETPEMRGLMREWLGDWATAGAGSASDIERNAQLVWCSPDRRRSARPGPHLSTPIECVAGRGPMPRRRGLHAPS